MMKLGIMQPYFFPYIGYWQLLNFVDTFVIFDDVNYIKRGWINRNKIVLNDDVKYINLYLNRSSQNKLVNEITVNNYETKQKTLQRIEEAYRRAPFYENIFPLIESILDQEECNLAKYNGYLIERICKYLDIRTSVFYSSNIKKNNNLKGQYKILDICDILGASDYYNPIGGYDLYDVNVFKKHNIRLHFLASEEICYRQFSENCIKNLSIVDLLMFNSKDRIKHFLGEFRIIEK